MEQEWGEGRGQLYLLEAHSSCRKCGAGGMKGGEESRWEGVPLSRWELMA